MIHGKKNIDNLPLPPSSDITTWLFIIPTLLHTVIHCYSCLHHYLSPPLFSRCPYTEDFTPDTSLVISRIRKFSHTPQAVAGQLEAG